MRKIKGKTFHSVRKDEIEKNELAIQVAELFYVDMLKRKQIAEKLGLSDPREVNKFLDYAREQGIINIEIARDPALYTQPQRDAELEENLEKLFDLEHAVVVNIPSYQEPYSIEEDNRIHQILGRALAEELPTTLRDRDHIGVSGGRATYACAQAMNILSRERPILKENIRITALAGGIARTPEIPPADLLSADNVAITMAAAVKGATRRLLSVPWIALKDKADYLKYPSELFISEEEWKKDKDLVPDVAIVGIGVIKERLHPFAHQDKPELAPIRDLLLALQAQISATGYDAVGDLGQRLFIIEPPEGVEVKQGTLEELRRLKNEINKHVVATTFVQLRKIDLVIAVAGGQYKRNAIWTVLTKPEGRILRRLCTDSATAKWLVEQKMKLREH